MPGRGSSALEVAARRRQVAALVLTGHNGVEISNRLGVHNTTVYRDMAVLRQEWQEQAARSHAEWMAEELATLGMLQRSLLPRALSGEDWGERLRVVDRLLALMRRRAKLLGLDEPDRIEIMTVDKIDAEIARLAEEVGVPTAG